MGFRVKLKRTFTSSSKKSSTEGEITPSNGEEYYTKRTDIEYYKPNEIPKSKYRGKVDPAHAASLQAFSLADAFAADRRRASLASGTFSPGGTKALSAAASRVHSRRPSWTSQHGSTLRTQSGVDSESSGSSSGTSREKSVAASTALDLETASTSLSDEPTAVPSAPAELNSTKLVLHDSGIHIPELDGLSKQVTIHDTPFTAEELEQAMSRATLKPREFGEGKIGVAL